MDVMCVCAYMSVSVSVCVCVCMCVCVCDRLYVSDKRRTKGNMVKVDAL